MYRGYYNASPECWCLYTEVLGAEFSNAVLFGQVHQLTVDGYAVQHAGGVHPDKSVGIHLSGLYLVLERGLEPPGVPPLLQRLAGTVRVWPHFPPPSRRTERTVFEVELSGTLEEHINNVKEWAAEIWMGWSERHGDVEALVSRHLP